MLQRFLVLGMLAENEGQRVMNTLKSFAQFSKDNRAFSVRSLRWIDFRAKDKTDPHYHRFAPAFHRIGRRVYVDEVKFLEIAKSGEGQ